MRHLCLAPMICLLVAATPPATTQSTQPAAEEIFQEKPKVHEMNAGTPGADGWCTARSTGDGFVVAMPQRYNDMSVSHHDEDGGVVRTHMVATTMQNGTRFSVSASVSPDGKLPGYATAKYVGVLEAKGTPRNRRAVMMDGVEGVEIEVVQPAQVMRYRVVQRGDTIYLMTLRRFGLEIPKDGESIAARFFESFRFGAPGVDQGPARRADAAASR